ncbi:MAG: hypothetical protein LBI84_09640 [Propionibacteriaceae bacterium]|nr:hypothetical protein [Propionibacteriaceae bacterium]
MAGLKPKDKQPNSANTLNNWIARAERDMMAAGQPAQAHETPDPFL